ADRDRYAFPSRRSSDLGEGPVEEQAMKAGGFGVLVAVLGASIASGAAAAEAAPAWPDALCERGSGYACVQASAREQRAGRSEARSEEHTSELQSRENLV